MAGVPIADSMKVTVLLLQNVTGESMQFGFHTGKREDEDSLHDIHNAAVDFANGLSGDGIICGMSIVGTSEAYWLTGGGFTGWHQIHHEDENIALSTAAQLPPQCALVASYRNTSETLVPRGRKRNRMYLGLLRADLLENDGTIIAGDATAVRAAMNELNTALEAITDADPIFAPQGLAVVSPTAGECYEVNEVGCGEAVDTHRSRRQKEPENMIWQAAS